MLVQTQVGAIPGASLPDGQQPYQLAGKAGEGVVAELHGKFYTQAYRGNVFVATTASVGVALAPISSTGAGMGLWNPLGSGKVLVPITFGLGVISVSTPGAGTFGLGYQTGVGGQIGTAAPIVAIPAYTPVNMNLGSGVTSVAKAWQAASCTFTAAPSALMSLGMSAGTAALTVPESQPMQLYPFDGQLVLSPGSAITVAEMGATGFTVFASLVWYEAPI